MENNFYKKLMLIQTELKAPKDKVNNFSHFNYRSAEGIMEAVKPLLKKYEVALTLEDEILLIGNRYYIKSTATLQDGDNKISKSAFAREEESKKGYDASQLTGATSSYARKYALNGLFCIDDNKDADTEEYHNQQQGTQPVPQQKIVVPQDVLNAIQTASTISDLSAIWNANKQFQTVPQFVNTLSERKKQIKAA